VVVIGRTFGELHGSDPMEPAALGKAVICGPRMGDFRESADALLAANAMVRVDRMQLAARLRALLSDDDERARMGRVAQEVVRIHQGATERTAEALLAILPQRQGSHA